MESKISSYYQETGDDEIIIRVAMPPVLMLSRVIVTLVSKRGKINSN